MSKAEIALFTKWLRGTRNYLEFGCGGSTVHACSHVRKAVIAVDSSSPWLAEVRQATKALPIKPKLIHVDIGPIKEWGTPADESRRSSWPNYHSDVWRQLKVDVDFCLVDGRFRVACFLQALLHLGPDAKIAIHDFRDRPEYHVVLEFVQQFESIETLYMFKRAPDFQAAACVALLEHYKFQSD